MERQAGGGYKYVKRTEFYGGCSLDDVNILERAAFQQGHKRIAIISDAASAGISLHADKAATNRSQRVHITLELAWSADKTVQQLGRSHRSNQVSSPIYKIVSTNICGEHRFASAVAHRLQQLGALTQGDRRAASASEAMAAFNLQTRWAREALRVLFALIALGGEVPAGNQWHGFSALDPPWLESEMRQGLPGWQELPEKGTPEHTARRATTLSRWCQAAVRQMSSVGLMDKPEAAMAAALSNRRSKAGGPSINTLLNRMLGLQVAMQGQLFAYFTTILDKVVSNAKKEGKYESTSIIKPGCESISLRSSTVICEHPNGAAATSHSVFNTDRGVNWEKAIKLLEEELEIVRKQQGEAAVAKCGAGFYYSDSATTRFYCLALPRNERGTREAKVRNTTVQRALYVRLVRPTTGFAASDAPMQEFVRQHSKMTNMSLMEKEWTAAYNSQKGRDQRMVPLHLVTGSVLPLLTTINRVVDSHRMASGRVKRLQARNQQKKPAAGARRPRKNRLTAAEAAAADRAARSAAADDEGRSAGNTNLETGVLAAAGLWESGQVEQQQQGGGGVRWKKFEGAAASHSKGKAGNGRGRPGRKPREDFIVSDDEDDEEEMEEDEGDDMKMPDTESGEDCYGSDSDSDQQKEEDAKLYAAAATKRATTSRAAAKLASLKRAAAAATATAATADSEGDDADLTISSRGRVRRSKLLPDEYVSLDEVVADDQSQPQEQQQSESEDGDDHGSRGCILKAKVFELLAAMNNGEEKCEPSQGQQMVDLSEDMDEKLDPSGSQQLIDLSEDADEQQAQQEWRLCLPAGEMPPAPLACTPLPWGGSGGSKAFETCTAQSGAQAQTATPCTASTQQQQQQQNVHATPMPVTPGAGSPAISAAQQQQQVLISIGSDANNVITPMEVEIAQQRRCGSNPAAPEITITPDAVKGYLEAQPKGATAAQVLKAFCNQFSCASGSAGVEKQVAGVLAGCLQQLVDDVEVFRKGKSSVSTAQVDMSDSETLYIALC
eukprot:gene14308-35_t